MLIKIIDCPTPLHVMHILQTHPPSVISKLDHLESSARNINATQCTA